MLIDMPGFPYLIDQNKRNISCLSFNVEIQLRNEFALSYFKRTTGAYYSIYRLGMVSSITHFKHKKIERSGMSVVYYPNSCASRQILLQGDDISLNPGPVGARKASIKCCQCEKTVRSTQKKVICVKCFGQTHLTSSTINLKMQCDSHWT